MKHAVFMAVVTLIGAGGTVAAGPHVGLTVYYVFSMLRPQFLWNWSLSAVGADTVAWSFYVAVVTLGGTALGLGGGPRPRFGPVHLALWGLAVWVTLSFAFARHPEKAAPYYEEYAKIFVMFTCGAFAVRTVGQVWGLTVAVAATDVYLGYEVNAMYLSGGLPRDWVSLTGGLDNNGVGLMFAMGIPVCYFLWEGTRHPLRWGYVFGIAVLGHAVLLSMSRGAMLSLIVAGPLLLYFSTRKREVLGFLAVAAVGVLATAGPAVQERFFSISAHDADESANSRKTSWAIAIRMANEEPIFGLGVRNSVLYTRAYGADIEGRAIHNMYLQLAADCGWVGMGWFVFLLVAAGFAAAGVWRRHRDRDDTDAIRSRALAAGAACALGVYAFGAVFLSLDTFEFPYMLILVVGQLAGMTPTAASGTTDSPAIVVVPGWPYPWLPLAAPLRPR
ncbi:MAG: O-antigen ligase family protein [Fimbriiglobus sp.]